MSVGTLLRGRLITDAGVSALVGTRVYPIMLPQTPTMPAIRYQRISNSEQDGSSSLRVTRFQVDCWDDDVSGIWALASAVKDALEGWTDTDQTPAVKMARVVDERDGYESETGLFRVGIDVILNTMGD